MAIWLATGPPGMAWSAPATVVTCSWPVKFWTTPPASSTRATTKASGSRMRRLVRTRSTQKLPMVRERERTRPRIRATITAMPAAAETKFCTASPSIWVRWLIVVSPA